MNKKPVAHQDHSEQAIQSISIETSSDAETLDTYLKCFVVSLLLPIPPDNQYNTPYEIAAFLSSIREGFKYGEKTISLFTVISFLLKYDFVPLKNQQFTILLNFI